MIVYMRVSLARKVVLIFFVVTWPYHNTRELSPRAPTSRTPACNCVIGLVDCEDEGRRCLERLSGIRRGQCVPPYVAPPGTHWNQKFRVMQWVQGDTAWTRFEPGGWRDCFRACKINAEWFLCCNAYGRFRSSDFRTSSFTQ